MRIYEAIRRPNSVFLVSSFLLYRFHFRWSKEALVESIVQGQLNGCSASVVIIWRESLTWDIYRWLLLGISVV